MTDTLASVLRSFNVLVMIYFVAITVAYLLITIASAIEVRRYHRRSSSLAAARMLRSAHSPSVTICTSAYNEAETIVEAVRSMLSLKYPDHRVALVNDGSTDRTLDTLIEAFALRQVDQVLPTELSTAAVRGVYRSDIHRNLMVIDKENGGRSDGLNAAINAADTELVCCIDADSLLEYDALLGVVQPFVEDPGRVVGAGGLIRVANGCEIDHGHVTRVRLPKKPVAMFQLVEYLRAFLAARTGWSAINGLVIISGAFGVFRRDVVVEVGGFATDSIGEDFELCVRLHQHAHDHDLDHRLVFVPGPVCWTEAPDRLRVLGKQRNRWERGLVDTLWRHRRMIGNPRYGVVGLLSLPFYVAFEFLGAFIETIGLAVFAISWIVGAIDLSFAVVFIALAITSGVLLSLAAVLLEDVAFRRHGRPRELVRMLCYAVAENFGYRQILTLYRLQGVWAYLRRDNSWGEMSRRGFVTATTPDPAEAPRAD